MAFVNCVCWEWQRDDGGFSPYPPPLSHAIEAANHAGMGSHDLDSNRTYTVDFMKMTQRKNTSGYERAVQRRNIMLPSSPAVSYYWSWMENKTNFVLYDMQSSVDIELAFCAGSATINLATCTTRLPYTIDFLRMEQTRHGYNTIRKIQRHPLPAGTSVQSLLTLAPMITGPTGFASGGTGFGYPSLAPAGHNHSFSGPGIVNSVPISTVPSVPPSGHVMGKSGMTGLTSSVGFSAPKPMVGPATKLLKSLGAPRHLTGHTVVSTTPVSNSTAASLPPTAVSMSSSAISPPPPCSTTTTSSHSSRSAASPSKKRREHKSKSSSSSHPTHSSAAAVTAGATANSTSVKKKTKRGRTKKRSEKDEELFKFARKKKKLRSGDDGPCPICMNNLSEPSGFEEEDHGSNTPDSIYKLRKCGHLLHHPCLIMYMKNSTNSGFQCPTCKKSYGVKTGDMPNGTMSVRSLPGTRLPGHEHCGAVEITYNFSPGVYNGRRYNASAFPRVCYLPDSPKGQKVLKLLRVAWERRLTFTIGTSVTSGMTDTVVWNEIHHKTTIQNHSGHGYPDPNYLDRVMLELAAQGVTDEQDDSDNDQGSSSSSSDDEDELEVVGGARGGHGNSKATAIVL